MIYIGYPVNMEEALRLFKLPRTVDSFNPQWWKCSEYINNEIIKYGLNFYYLDKGFCVVGIEVNNNLGNIWYDHKNIDDCIIGLIQLKKLVKEKFESSGIDLSRIEITHMEGEDVIVSNPEPYFINYPV
jgi:hypothetical protein